MGDQTILRTVIPFRNREACHRCHDPSHRINGIMLFDLDAGGIRDEVNSDLRWLVGGTAAFALVLIVLIAIVVRVFVLRRLQRFETTARLIAGGDLAQRIPAEGADTVSWLAREFNTMADSVTGLVGEVRSERERLETVINSIDDGIVVLDPQRKVVAANDAFLQRTGTVRDEAVGCSCRDVTTSLCAFGDCPTLACLGSGSAQVRICERRKPDGSVAWEEVHASPIRGPDGTLVQVVEVWRDITERRAAEARLAESHRLASLGQLASGFSHEMNTPLGTVLACVEGILREASRAAGEPGMVEHRRERRRRPGADPPLPRASPSTSCGCRADRPPPTSWTSSTTARAVARLDRADRARRSVSGSTWGRCLRGCTPAPTSRSSSTPSSTWC